MAEVDMTKYPDAIYEIIKYMDFLPDDDATRMNFVVAFVTTAMLEIYLGA